MKKLMAAFAASVMALGAFAEVEWFNAQIKGTVYNNWPTTQPAESTMKGVWTSSTASLADVTDLGTGNTIEVDTGSDASLNFEATQARAVQADGDAVTITSQVKFNPFKDGEEILSGETSAKAGIFVQDNGTGGYAFYTVVKDQDNETNVWCEGSWEGEFDPGTTYEVVIKLFKVDGENKVSYKVGDYYIDDNEDGTEIYLADTVQKVCFSGSGTVEELRSSSDSSPVEVTFKLPANATVTKLNGEDYDPQEPPTFTPYAIVTATIAATGDYLFADGSLTMDKQCEVTANGEIDLSEEASVTPVLAAVKIVGTDSRYINLTVAASNAVNDATFLVLKDFTNTGTAIFDGGTKEITMTNTLDLGGHTVQTTDGGYALTAFGASLTVTNGVWLKQPADVTKPTVGAGGTASLVGDAEGHGSKGGIGTTGEMKFVDVEMKRNNVVGGSVCKIENGLLTVESGLLQNICITNGEYRYAIDCCADGRVVINGGTFDGYIGKDEGGSVVIPNVDCTAKFMFDPSNEVTPPSGKEFQLDEQDNYYKLVDATSVFSLNGQKYSDFATMYNDLVDGDTVTMQLNYTLNDSVTLDKTFTLDLNGSDFTVAAAMSVEADVEVTGDTGSFINQNVITIAADVTLTVAGFVFDEDATSACYSLGSSATLAITATDAVTPNWYNAKKSGYFSTDDTSYLSVNGAFYTWDGDTWALDDAKALADVTIEDVDLENEGYADFDAANAAVRENGTITLLDDLTISEAKTVKETATLSVNGNEIDLNLESASLTYAGELEIGVEITTSVSGKVVKYEGGVYFVGDPSSPGTMPEIEPSADATTVSNAVTQAGFVDPKVQAIVDGDVGRYNALKTWATEVGQSAAIASPNAAVSFEMSSISEAHLFTNDPTIKVESLDLSSGFSMTVKVYDGNELVNAIEAIQSHVQTCNSLEANGWGPATAEATVSEGVATITITNLDPDCAFLKVETSVPTANN